MINKELTALETIPKLFAELTHKTHQTCTLLLLFISNTRDFQHKQFLNFVIRSESNQYCDSKIFQNLNSKKIEFFLHNIKLIKTLLLSGKNTKNINLIVRYIVHNRANQNLSKKTITLNFFKKIFLLVKTKKIQINELNDKCSHSKQLFSNMRDNDSNTLLHQAVKSQIIQQNMIFLVNHFRKLIRTKNNVNKTPYNVYLNEFNITNRSNTINFTFASDSILSHFEELSQKILKKLKLIGDDL